MAFAIDLSHPEHLPTGPGAARKDSARLSTPHLRTGPIRTQSTPPSSPTNVPIQEAISSGLLTPPDSPPSARRAESDSTSTLVDAGAPSTPSLLVAEPQPPTLEFLPKSWLDDYEWGPEGSTHCPKLPARGHGAWSTVYAAHTNRFIAESETGNLGGLLLTYPRILAIKLPSSNYPMPRKVIAYEARILTHLFRSSEAHRYIVGFYGLDRRRHALVMDCSDSDLGKHVDRGVMDAPMVFDLATHLVKGLAFIHGAHVVHGDIKPSNILLRCCSSTSSQPEQLLPLYCDFSSSFLTTPDLQGEEEQIDASANTYDFMAPELFTRRGRRRPEDQSTDMFALGATLLACLIGGSPYAGMSRMQLISMAKAGQIVAAAESTAGTKALANLSKAERIGGMRLVSAMVEAKPENRPSAEQCLTILRKISGSL